MIHFRWTFSRPVHALVTIPPRWIDHRAPLHFAGSCRTGGSVTVWTPSPSVTVVSMRPETATVHFTVATGPPLAVHTRDAREQATLKRELQRPGGRGECWPFAA
jgi:hypothetical protein